MLFYLLLLSITASLSQPLVDEGIAISWSNLCVGINSEIGHSASKTILSMPYHGKIHSGRLLGIIGPSGAGKSTLLNILSGRLRTTSSYSKYLSNGMSVTSDLQPQLEGHDVAFIYQDDAFFSMLSVTETLTLAAALKLKYVYNGEHQHKAIDESLSTMSLFNVKDSLVGDPLNTRGISGGERKRLSVACELLSNPKLLVADEPTSGLDSYQAFSVVQQIKRVIVDRNIAGVATLHQPRSSIYALIDDLLLMAPGGQVVYHGERDKARQYFNSIGYPCPADSNPAEHLIDLVSIDYTSEESIATSNQQIGQLVHHYSDYCARAQLATTTTSSGSSNGGNKNRGGKEDNGRRKGRRTLGVLTRARQASSMLVGVVVETKDGVGRFFLLLQRAMRQNVRDKATNLVRFGIAALLAKILSKLYGKQTDELTEGSVGDRITIIAQAAIQISMLSMIKTLQLFKKERPVISREMASGQYSCIEYLFSKSLAELPLDALVASVFGYVLQTGTNLHNRRDFIETLALLGCASSSLGLAVGALAPTADIALAVGPALMVVYVIMGAIGPVSGNNKAELPPYLQWVRQASPIRPACEALCFSEFRGREFNQSKRGIGQWFRAISNLLRFRPSTTTSTSKGVTSFGRMSGGDHVLNDLQMDINSMSCEGSKRSLRRMLGVHSLLAFIGLFFSAR